MNCNYFLLFIKHGGIDSTVAFIRPLLQSFYSSLDVLQAYCRRLVAPLSQRVIREFEEMRLPSKSHYCCPLQRGVATGHVDAALQAFFDEDEKFGFSDLGVVFERSLR